GSTLADYTEFDRKNYFYPDLPKGYQISQYEYPLVSGGTLNGIAITRIHLEEDTASSVHHDVTDSTSSTSSEQVASPQAGETLIDYNRSGVPLMELVTEPVITSAEQAGAFCRELQLLLRYLGASDANMEKGEMRVEANISVSKTSAFGTKVEVKNLNSFRIMERAVAYEIERHISVLEKGGSVVQETRGWDENKQATFPQRVKEGSADYRYFPDPDLPSLKLSEIPSFASDTLKTSLPELPWQRRDRYIGLGIKTDDADLYVRTSTLGTFFEEVTRTYKVGDPKIVLASNYIANDLVNITRLRQGSGGQVRDTDDRDSETQHEIPISSDNFKKIIDMVGEDKISSRSAKDLIQLTIEEKKDPAMLATEKNFLKAGVSPEQLEEIVSKVITNNPSVVVEYKSGKIAVMEYLVGQGVKELHGSGDPALLRSSIQKRLDA
ncbi:MAG: Asp-tRNA(Asn)/Glu-tRNA(Gln) amidotransferase subunit GatB, partial [Nitrososphaera sp.]|nr:Asp-tRNA(Asn)/Glu-tRNA(Gln) amidotransferase subunit GatB [Nitrososphaera sp.]